MTKPLPVGTIVRVVPGKECEIGAKLISGGLYKIYIANSNQVGTTYCLGNSDESKWVTRKMIQVVELKLGSLVLLDGLSMEVYCIAAGKNYQDNKLCGISVKLLGSLTQIPYWIPDGKLKLYGI